MQGVKQVIVIRRDLKMRRGKEIAQGSHASMAFLTRRMESDGRWMPKWLTKFWKYSLSISPVEKQWLDSSFAKVTLQVQSEDELVYLHESALAEGLESHLITDSGRTEFDGVPTKTAITIGPDYSEKIDKITGELKLY